MESTDLIGLTAEIVSAHIGHNSVSAADLPDLIRSVHEALARTEHSAEVAQPAQEPAVSVRASIKQDHLVCLEDGKKMKMLKRYFRTNYDMTPNDYRAKWNLPRDYPMVAPAYAERRRSLAHQIGLGRKKVVEEVEIVTKAVKRGAKKVAEVTEAVVSGQTIKPVRKRLGNSAAKAAAWAHLNPAPESVDG